MTCLPMAPCSPQPMIPSTIPAATEGTSDADPGLMNIGSMDPTFRKDSDKDNDRGKDDQQFLLRAFRSFSAAAASLERSYGELQLEVARLRREVESSRAGLERSLEENRRMRAHLDRILESLPCGVVVASHEGAITHLNPEAVRLLGLSIEGPSIKGSSGRPLSLADLPAAACELLGRSRHSGCESEASLPDEYGRWLAARHAVLSESDRKSNSSVFILQDVSERKRLEQAEQKLRREQALAEMSALLAHEIRNPLGSLELFAGLLAESTRDLDSRKWISHIQAGLRTLAATVNNVLHFHSLPEPELAPVDLGSLLDWANGFLTPLACQAQLQLFLEHSLAGVGIAGDRHRLEQVLLNLILNAIRATPEGGSIHLMGKRVADGVAIIVTDTGPGIPSECLGRIFEPGFSTRPSSPGLGLAVCRKIVEQHSGTITVETPPGKGAWFTLYLPIPGKSIPGVSR
jgi:two-component system, sensor histidine kinase FlrB